MTKLKRPASNPAYIALRSAIKGDFIDALQAQPNHLAEWKDAKLVVFGSTLMRQLQVDDAVYFPLGGRKSSDIDIGIYTPDPRTNYESNYLQLVCPALKQACINSGLNVVTADSHPGGFTEKSFTNGEIASLDNMEFAKDFIVSRTFTEDEAKSILREQFPNDPEAYAASLKDIQKPDGSITIDLIISSTPVPTPTLLSPAAFDHAERNGHLQLYRDHRLNMLAAKIVRNFVADRYKPTDLIDIYNLLHSKADVPLFNFDPDSPSNQLDDLRCLIVANLAIFRCHEPWKDANILQNYTLSDETVSRYKLLIEGNVSKYGPCDDNMVRAVIGDCKNFIECVMSPRGVSGYGPLHLTLDDINFITSVNGYQILPGMSGTQQIEPTVSVDLLRKQYPRVFAEHEELATNLRCNHYLNDRMQYITERRQQIEG